MTTITTRTDLSDHVADTCANHSEFEQQQIVEILVFRADRPAWGDDWSNWLETALLDACDEVIAVNAGQPEPPPSDDEDDDESAPVDHAARLARAAARIDAVELGDGDWAHHADETSSWWVVTADELEELCDYLDSDEPMIAEDAYSHWCAGCGGEEQPSWWTPDVRVIEEAAVVALDSVRFEGEGDDRVSTSSYPRALAEAMAAALRERGIEASVAPDCEDRSQAWLYADAP